MIISVNCRLLKIILGEPFIWKNRKISSYGMRKCLILPESLHESSKKLLLYNETQYSVIRERATLAKESNQSNDDWGGPEAEKLIIHLKDNILDVIKEYDSFMVYFYTTWCGHCKQMKSIYGLAALKMMKEGIPGHLGAIDITKRMDIADIFEIVAVPILKYFRKGEYIMVYNEKRTVDDIVNFMKNPPEKPFIIPKMDI